MQDAVLSRSVVHEQFLGSLAHPKIRLSASFISDIPGRRVDFLGAGVQKKPMTPEKKNA